MQIFRRKPFMLCCFCFIASAVTSFLIVGKAKMIAALLLGIISIAAFILLLCIKKRGIKIKLTLLLLASMISFGGFAEYYFYYDVRAAAFDPYVGRVVETDVTVIEERRSETYYAEYFVSVNSVGGEKIVGKALFQVEGEPSLHRGETLTVFAECISLDEYAFSKSALLSYVSDGITGAFSVSEEDSTGIIIKERTDKPSLYSLNSKLTYKLETIIGGEAGSLSAAMLLGRRDRLSDETSRDFSRSGISHTLALSGLHLAVIAGFFELILKKLGVSKLIRCILIPVAVIGYLALTGFAISTVRAAVMLGAVYFSYIIAAPIDKLTVLFASCAAILAISPAAVADIGFWMSYVSAFGLMLGAPYLSKIFRPIAVKKRSEYSRAVIRASLRYVFGALLVAIIAAFSLLFLSQLAFGEISAASPAANLLCGPLVTLDLILSLLFLAVGFSPTAERGIAFLLQKVGDAILGIASYFSDVENVSVSLEYGFAKILVVLFTVSMAVLLIVRLRKKIFLLLPATAFVLLFSVCFISLVVIKGGSEADVTYLRRGESEIFTVSRGTDVAFIDLSDGNYSNLSAAWDDAHSRGATEIENVVLTHYHRKHAYSLRRLVSAVKVRRITLPYPESYEESLHLSVIYDVAAEHGVECVMMLDEGYTELVRGVGIDVLPREFLSRSKQSVVAFDLYFGNESLTYVGSSYYESSSCALADDYVDRAEYVVYGTHGPNLKAEFSAYPAKNANEIIFADGELLEFSRVENADFDSLIVYDCEIRRIKILLLK